MAHGPHGEVDEAYERILDVRDAIHVVTGRGRDRLTREDQDACAALLGHPDADAMLTELSGAARIIAYAVDGTLRRALQSQRARTLRVGPRRPQLVPLGFGLYRHDGEAVLGPSADVTSDQVIPFRAAVVAARNAIPLSPATLRNLAAHSPSPGEPWPEAARGVFADLLAAGPGLVTVWEGLDLAGIVERWIPEWAAVRSRPQRNLVHRHTVDRHLVETVVAASGFVRDVARPDLLVLAALLHDIGKVAGALDHSHVGAGLADRILRRMGTSDPDREVVVRLVREHLTLVELATRRDPEDPATIAVLSEAVGGSAMILDLLRALTEADASAAGPKAWTDWRAGLVARLYAACRAALLAANGADGTRVLEPVEPVELLALGTDALDKVAVGDPHVTVTSMGGAYRVDIVDRDRVGLFADSAGLLAAHRFVVRSALVRTIDGVAVNEWWVDSPGGERPLPDTIARDLVRIGSGDRSPLGRLHRRKATAAIGTGPVRSPGSGAPDSTRAMVVTGHGHRGPGDRPPGTPPRHRHHAGPRLTGRPLGTHRDVCRADPRHVLRHGVRRWPVGPGEGGPGRGHDHRHLRRTLTHLWAAGGRSGSERASGSELSGIPNGRGSQPNRNCTLQRLKLPGVRNPV